MLLVVLAVVGCGASRPSYEIPADEPPLTYGHGVWIEDGIPIIPVLAGCGAWSVVGVECGLAESRETALVVVGDSDEPQCVPDDSGQTWWGQGGINIDARGIRSANGWAHLHMKCFPNAADAPPEFIAMVTHEIGHALGISAHSEHVGAVMYPWLSKDSPRAVTAEDIAMYYDFNPTLRPAP